ncbi:MAG: capsule assembly Wzi family protein [Deltaproteobacteria bacterium]
MRIKSLIVLVILLVSIYQTFTQIPVNTSDDMIRHSLDRLEIKYNTQLHDINLSSPTVNEVSDLIRFVLDSARVLNLKEIANLRYILDEYHDWNLETGYDIKNNENDKEPKGILGVFYKHPSNFYAKHAKNFFIQLDPVIYITAGKDLKSNRLDFQNSRGFSVSGLIDKKIFFQSSLLETQRSYLSHIESRITRDQAIPGQGLYKTYSSSVLNGVNGYDFMNAQAKIGFNITKSITAQLGHGKFNIGNGIRSLFLSDYAHNYYFLRFNTKIWRFNYQNIFAELSAMSHRNLGGDKIIPKKYMASHHLSFKPTHNLEFGLFESIIFKRDNHFELQYLNPVIIYRTVEHFIGSPDNVLVGFDFKYNFFKRFSIYGQMLLDEFNFSILKEDQTWWANKYGLQGGIKYIDAFNINQLDMQLEYNVVRPFTYSHHDSLNSYSHFNQPLAHPLGANFRELIFCINYKPFNRFIINTNAIFVMQGEDIDERSYGSNILKSNSLRPLDREGNLIDFGYFTGFGEKTYRTQYKLNLSYMLFHNYFIDLDILYYSRRSDKIPKTEELYIGGGLRINLSRNTPDF